MRMEGRGAGAPAAGVCHYGNQELCVCLMSECLMA